MKTQLPETLHELINSRAWQSFEESKLGNDLFISDRDRASRIYDVTEQGADGSTHAEHIDDQREYISDLRSNALGECETDDEENAVENWHNSLTAKLDEIEQWHEKNGSLHEEVG